MKDKVSYLSLPIKHKNISMYVCTSMFVSSFSGQELRPKPGEQMISLQILSNFLLLTTKQKSSAEQALQEFMNIAGQDSYKDHVGAILGMATAYMILKQVSLFIPHSDDIFSSH